MGSRGGAKRPLCPWSRRRTLWGQVPTYRWGLALQGCTLPLSAVAVLSAVVQPTRRGLSGARLPPRLPMPEWVEVSS